MKQVNLYLFSFIMIFSFSFFSLMSMEGQTVLGYCHREDKGKKRVFCLFDCKQNKIIDKTFLDDSFGKPLMFLKNGKQILLGKFQDQKRDVAPYELQVFDIAEKRIIKQHKNLRFDSAVSVSFSPDGEHYVEVGLNFEPRTRGMYVLKVKRLGTNEVIRVIRPFYSWDDLHVKFSPEGEYIVMHDDFEFISVWSLKTGKRLKTFQSSFQNVSVSYKAKYIAINRAEIVSVRGRRSGKIIEEINVYNNIDDFVLSYDGTHMAIYYRDENYVLLFDIKTKEVRGSISIKTEDDYDIDAYAISFMQFRPPVKEEIKDFDELERCVYLQQILQKEISDVMPKKLKVKVRIHGKDDFYVPRLPL